MSGFMIVDELDRERWDTFVTEHAKGSVFHTAAMVEVFKRTQSHNPLVLAAVDRHGAILALLVAVRIQTLPPPLGTLSSRSVLFAEPLCRGDALGIAALAELLAQHDAEVGGKVLFTEVRALRCVGAEREALSQSGYVYEDYLNFLIDLRQPEETLWHAMTQDCRRRIRSNAKKGLTIEDATQSQELDTFYRLVGLSYERARVPLAHRSLFAAALEVLRPQDMIRISIARYDGQPVAATAMLLFSDTAFAWYGGSERLQAVHPMESLIWHEMTLARQLGGAVYDFGGAGWPDKPYGVRDFKAKFGGDLVNYGRYRKVYSPWKFALAERSYEMGRSLVNPKRWG